MARCNFIGSFLIAETELSGYALLLRHSPSSNDLFDRQAEKCAFIEGIAISYIKTAENPRELSSVALVYISLVMKGAKR